MYAVKDVVSLFVINSVNNLEGDYYVSRGNKGFTTTKAIYKAYNSIASP